MKTDFLPLCFQKTLHKVIEVIITVVTRNGQRLEFLSLKNRQKYCVQGWQCVSILITMFLTKTLPCSWSGRQVPRKEVMGDQGR